MRSIKLVIVLLILATGTFAQTNPLPLRIADTLTAQEKLNRQSVILRSELDSLIKIYLPAQEPKPVVREPENVRNEYDHAILAGIGFIILLLLVSIYISYINKSGRSKLINGKTAEELITAQENVMSKNNPVKSKKSVQSLESKIIALDAELNKLLKENQSLNSVIAEYNGIQREYDSLKAGIDRAYKIKNYPGYDKQSKGATSLIKVLETENAVAMFAYGRFVKPLLEIADANKNHPTRISDQDRARIADLLVSLSLLYIEYLYLRVQELSVGGRIVERLHGVIKGKEFDPALLKKLDKEFGTRALVIHLALGKAGIQPVSYPVFDETNLNDH